MAETIRIRPEELRNKAQQIRAKKEQEEMIISKIATIINSLNEQWTGAAQEAYVTKFQEMQPRFEHFTEMIEAYATNMEKSAQILEQVDEELAKSIASYKE